MENIFKIKRGERLGALIVTLYFTLLNGLHVAKYYSVLSPQLKGGLWYYFVKYVHISGYDAKFYSTITRWSTEYDVFRHPFLNFMLYPFYLLDQWLIDLTGVNCMQFIVAVLLVVTACYTYVFLRRLLYEVLELPRFDVILLLLLFFSFGYVQLCLLVPDHFPYSMMLLVMVLWLAGKRIRERSSFPIWQGVVLYLVVMGTTLTNGVKVLLALLFTNGRKLFQLRTFLLMIIVPTILVLGFCIYEREAFEKPRMETLKNAEANKRHAIEKKLEKQGKWKALAKMKNEDRERANRPQKGVIESYIHLDTPHYESIVENLLGEPVQFHQKYFLGDVSNRKTPRPMIVAYDHWANYAVSGFIVFLVLMGIWCGRRERLLWMALSWFAFDMLMHVVLGFGLNEVYIFSVHWLFIIPLTLAYLMRRNLPSYSVLSSMPFLLIRLSVFALILYLWIYNGSMLIGYLVE